MENNKAVANWERGEVKTRAKNALQDIYGFALILSVILYLAGTYYFWSPSTANPSENDRLAGDSYYHNIGMISFGFDMTNCAIKVERHSMNGGKTTSTRYLSRSYFMPRWMGFIAFEGNKLLVSIILGACIKIFIGYRVQVSCYQSILHMAKNGGYTFSVLKADLNLNRRNYWNIVGAMFLRDLCILLGSLLVIPGIILRYMYIFVPYILAENPGMKPRKAMQISMKMTRGHKLNMFVLSLSFWGWYILGDIALGVGVVLIWPYETATFAQLYLILKKDDRDYC